MRRDRGTEDPDHRLGTAHPFRENLTLVYKTELRNPRG